MTITDSVKVNCVDCGHPIMVKPDDGVVSGRNFSCDDCFFDRFGDMFTLRELRHSRPLRDPKLEALRLQYIAEAEKTGRHPDIDPSTFTVTVEAGEDGQVRFSDPRPVYVDEPPAA